MDENRYNGEVVQKFLESDNEVTINNNGDKKMNNQVNKIKILKTTGSMVIKLQNMSYYF